MNTPAVEKAIRDLLVALGRDPTREGLRDTPERVAGAYAELLSGYARSLKDELATFTNDSGYDQLVVSSRIDFTSLCEHHLLPFVGHAWVGYIPGDRIIGLSKLSRVVDIFARRLQNQERLTDQIADEVEAALAPIGVGVVLEAQHLCSVARGVRKKDSAMSTVAFRGALKTDAERRREFYTLVRGAG